MALLPRPGRFTPEGRSLDDPPGTRPGLGRVEAPAPVDGLETAPVEGRAAAPEEGRVAAPVDGLEDDGRETLPEDGREEEPPLEGRE